MCIRFNVFTKLIAKQHFRISLQHFLLGLWFGICVEHLSKLAEQRIRDLGAHPQSQFSPRDLNMIQRAFGSLQRYQQDGDPTLPIWNMPIHARRQNKVPFEQWCNHDAYQNFICGLNKNIIHVAVYNSQKGKLIWYDLLPWASSRLDVIRCSHLLSRENFKGMCPVCKPTSCLFISAVGGLDMKLISRIALP